MFQMRKPHKTPAEKLGDMETSNLPKKEFRVMIIMTKELRFTEQEVRRF